MFNRCSCARQHEWQPIEKISFTSQFDLWGFNCCQGFPFVIYFLMDYQAQKISLANYFFWKWTKHMTIFITVGSMPDLGCKRCGINQTLLPSLQLLNILVLILYDTWLNNNTLTRMIYKCNTFEIINYLSLFLIN